MKDETNVWLVSVIVDFDEEDLSQKDLISIRSIMSDLIKTSVKYTYFLKSRRNEYSSLSTDIIISKIKHRLLKKNIYCQIHVGRPLLAQYD